jgi:hypothetical protein
MHESDTHDNLPATDEAIHDGEEDIATADNTSTANDSTASARAIASSGSTLTDDSTKLQEIRRQMADGELCLVSADSAVDVGGAYKLPFDQIPALGVAFSSLSKMFRTVQGTVSSPMLWQVTDKFGNIVDSSRLMVSNDHTGYLASMRSTTHGFEQARLQPIKPGTITSTTVMPFNPALLFFGMALAQINVKLDAIQKSVKQILSYMQIWDKARLRGNLQTLNDILKDYKLNLDNAVYMRNAHMKTLDIKQFCEQDIIFLRSQVEEKLQKRDVIEVRALMGGQTDELIDALRDYHLAVYTYAFALFLEPVLCENFKESKLESVLQTIEDESVRYRELYTRCYDVIDAYAKKAADTVALGALSKAAKTTGETIAASLAGKYVNIDNMLMSSGDSIEKFSEWQTARLLKKLRVAKSLDVMPFEESVKAINAIYNRPVQIAADAENIYLLPEDVSK